MSDTFLTEESILNRKLAVEALRTEPESLRVCKVLMTHPDGQPMMVCAIALLATKLGMVLERDSTTGHALRFVGEALGLPMDRGDLISSPGEELLNAIITMNDTVINGNASNPVYSWSDIGDALENRLRELELGWKQ